MKRLALALVAASFGCGRAPNIDQRPQPLGNATVDTIDPWVGVSETGCTATLIGRSTALTANHCVRYEGERQEFCIYPSNNLSDATGSFCQTGTVHRYPGYSGDGDWDHDVAVLALDLDPWGRTFADVYGIQPRRIGGWVGSGGTIRLVGYGYSGTNSRIKRYGYNSVSDVYGQTIEYDDNSRTYSENGDSGGPVFVGDSDCEVALIVTSGDTIWPFFDWDGITSRVDTKASWIQSVANDWSVYTCGQTSCGDGYCQSPETCATCPQDCGACPAGPCNGQPDGTVCGDDCCTGFNTCRAGVCTTGSCCNTAHCCSL
jgi:V8-like Glu-specific endopeptidase